MKKLPWQARQGDVFLEEIAPPKELGEVVKREGNAIVLANGETSAHRHQITTKSAKLFARGSARFLEIGARGGALMLVTSDRGEPLQVPRHHPVKVPPGVHRMTTQLEYTLEHEVKRVTD